MQNKQVVGHTAAAITVLIWGTTFIATKILLRSFSPLEILLARFLIGYCALLLIKPRRLHLAQRKQEWWFVAAGLSGITMYYLLENIALTYSTASNVGIITTISPFFTALLAMIFLKTEKPRYSFYIGFVVAISGVILISWSGATLHLNPLGDILAVLAAFAWAVYSIITKKISELNLNLILTTRHTFFYGILFMLPMTLVLDFKIDLHAFAEPINLGNILFLGLGACALCFVTWNTAVKHIGAVKSSVYIYLVPVITLIFSVWILHEALTPILIVGACLTLIGLWLSSRS
ncbi:DMT family transporter [Lacticaseibacillus zhaodongensis]|uniref:DMT family transporter n=1 Tax=Lacticaseibacillus zhaodongensis TaxID=2668065 RepID=UPI0012D319A0|nr:DMT family transporter [Lacticaseibacillus zhaodongensis]